MTGFEWLTFGAMVTVTIPIGLGLIRLAGPRAWAWLHSGQSLRDSYRFGRKAGFTLSAGVERVVAGLLLIPFLGLVLTPHFMITTAIWSSGETAEGKGELVFRNDHDQIYKVFIRPLDSWPVSEELMPPVSFVAPGSLAKMTLQNVIALDSTEADYDAYVKGQVVDVAYVVNHPELAFTDYGDSASSEIEPYLFAGAVWLMLCVVNACLFVAAFRPKATASVGN